MDLMEAIEGRRSIRKFLDEPVCEEDLKEIVRAGILAPNAENDQAWYFVAVTNKEVLNKISEVVNHRVDSIIDACKKFDYDAIEKHKYFLTFFKDAPALILAFARPSDNAINLALDKLNMDFKTPIPIDVVQQSIGAALQNISLAAHSKGYGTTWMFGPVVAYKEIAELVNVTEPWVLSAVLPIGRPAQSPKPRPRKSIDEVYTIIK